MILKKGGIPLRHNMKRTLGGTALALTAGLVAAPAQAVSNSTEAAGGSYAYAAKLSADGRSCSGALVEPTVILTAAGCFPENPQGGVPAKATTAAIGRAGGRIVHVTNLSVWQGRDVALARIDTPITDITPATLATNEAGVNEQLTLAGFGRTSTDWVPDALHTATFTRTSGTTGTGLGLTGANGADACKGDAGAPLLRTATDGHLEVVAVASTSWQHGCLGETETRQGTTAADTANLFGWILQQALNPAAKGGAHTTTVSWTPLAGWADYRVFGGTTADFPADPAHFLWSGQNTSYTDTSVPAGQTRYYRIEAFVGNGAGSQLTDPVSATAKAPARTDFNGDGKADVATFVRGSDGAVYVATSDGSKFGAGGVKWQDYFSVNGEIPLSGDFNGDGKADVATFTRSDTGDVYVALSDGTKFGPGVKWHDYFSVGDEIPAVGDFNGDGKDDIATFTRGGTGDVYVALSDGTKFGAGVKWHDYFCVNGELPYVGDFNGDGKDDIATFTRGTSGDVYVALSDGSGFGAGVKWHDFFGINDEIPAIGDFNGDGKDDIADFTRGSVADVYVALSDGTKFNGQGVKWQEYFAAGVEIPGTGDFDGDGKTDIATFTRGPDGDVYVAPSDGAKFGSGVKWHDYFCLGNEVPAPRAITVL